MPEGGRERAAVGEGDVSGWRDGFDRDLFAVDQFFTVAGFAVPADEKFFAVRHIERSMLKEGDFFGDPFGVQQVGFAVCSFDPDKPVLNAYDFKRLPPVE